MYGYGSPEELMAEVTDVGTQVHVDPEARRRFMEILERQGFIEGYENRSVTEETGTGYGSPRMPGLSGIPRGKHFITRARCRISPGVREQEGALHTSQLQLSEAMDLARIVYWELDPETDTLFLTIPSMPFTALRGTGRCYRMSREEFRTRFVHPDDIPLFRQVGGNTGYMGAGEFFHEFDIVLFVVTGRCATSWCACTSAGMLRAVLPDTMAQTRILPSASRRRRRWRNRKSATGSPSNTRTTGLRCVRKGDQHIYVNQRFLTMFGYADPGEILGTAMFVTVHPDDRERVMEINRRRQEGGPVPSGYELKGWVDGTRFMWKSPQPE